MALKVALFLAALLCAAALSFAIDEGLASANNFDLEIKKIEYSADTNKIVASVENLGGEVQGPVLFYFYVDGEKAGETIKSGIAAISTFLVYANYDLADGIHTISAIADPNSELLELNTENNKLEIRLEYNYIDNRKIVPAVNNSRMNAEFYAVIIILIVSIAVITSIWRHKNKKINTIGKEKEIRPKKEDSFLKEENLKGKEKENLKGKEKNEEFGIFSGHKELKNKEAFFGDENSIRAGQLEKRADAARNDQKEINDKKEMSPIISGNHENIRTNEKHIETEQPDVKQTISDAIRLPAGSPVQIKAEVFYQDKIGSDYVYFLKDETGQTIAFSKDQINAREAQLSGLIEEFLGSKAVRILEFK